MALGGCLAVVVIYLLWMASSSLSGKRGEPGWVHRQERGRGSLGKFRLRSVPSPAYSFGNSKTRNIREHKQEPQAPKLYS